MTKDEALAKIKELEEYVRDMNRPDLKRGQVWARGGDKYLVVEICREFTLVSLQTGNVWNSNQGFGTLAKKDFDYLGMISEICKL